MMKYTRLYSDEQGESHFENLEIEFQTVDFAPPAPPLEISTFGSVEQCSILKGKPGWKGDWHPAPYRQLHFYLSGEVEAETSNGEIRRIGTGDIALVEDTSGKGHRSRVVGSTEVIIVSVKLAGGSILEK
jgi:quercetin dioxygenase-like cupin family protein